MISSATLSTLGATPTRDPAVRLVDALSRLSPSAAASQTSPVQRLSPQPPTQAPTQPRSGRGSLLDLSV